MSVEKESATKLYYRKKYGNTRNIQWEVTANEVKTSKGNVGFFFEALLDIAANNLFNRGRFDQGDIAKASYYTGIPNKKGFSIVESFIRHNILIADEHGYELVNFAKYNPSFNNIQEYSEKHISKKPSKEFHNDYNNLTAKVESGKALNEKDVEKIPSLLEYFKNSQEKFKNLQEILRSSQEDLRQFKNDNILDLKSQILDSSIKKTKAKKDSNQTRFQKPTIQEISEYCSERQNTIDPETFYHHYESVGWKVGDRPMKSWQSSVITWEKNQRNNQTPKKTNFLNEYDSQTNKNERFGIRNSDGSSSRFTNPIEERIVRRIFEKAERESGPQESKQLADLSEEWHAEAI